MSHGGVRPGAGRPKDGGSKLDKVAREVALAGGVSPLDFLLQIMRDKTRDDHMRIDAAKAAAPYVHAKKASVEVTGPDQGPVQVQQIERIIVDPASV